MKRNLFLAADDPAWAARRIGYADPGLADTVPDDPAEHDTTLSTARTLGPDLSLEGCWSGTDRATLDALEQEAEQAQHDRWALRRVLQIGALVVAGVAALAAAASFIFGGAA